MITMAEMLSEREEEVLREIPSDSEYCVNYSYLPGTKEEMRPIVKRLKELEYIKFFRGLMSEDDDMPGGMRAAGSGWCRTVKGNNYVEERQL